VYGGVWSELSMKDDENGQAEPIDVFGLWREYGVDGLQYQEDLRAEWQEPD
jgi:hypothetical protein